MNILIINQESDPRFICGIKRVSSILGRRWKEIGHNVMCLCYVYGGDFRPQEMLGLKQQFLPNSEVIDCKENFDYFVNCVKEHNIDIVLHQFADSIELTRLCIRVKDATNIKLISTLHFSINSLNDTAKELFFVKYRLGNNPLNWLKDTLLFCNYHLRGKGKISKDIQPKLVEAYYGSDKIVVLSENYIPIFEKTAKIKDNVGKLIAINNPSIRPERIIREKEKRVLWCGRVEFGVKRVDRMMRIWKRVSQKFPDWELDIIGSGDIEFFRALAKRNGVERINIVGFANPQEFYDKAAILCMTSSTEGWGMVLVEAQSNGVVPIAYNSYASATDIINDGENGFLVKAFDEDEYVEKLSLLMSDKDKRDIIAERAIASVERFDYKYIADKWIDLFEKL